MLNAKLLQNSYNKLYTSLRQYIWPMHVVDMIADLEVSIYKVFPDLLEVRNHYNRLKVECLRYISDDEDMKAKFEDFREVLDSSDQVFSKLDVRLEGAE